MAISIVFWATPFVEPYFDKTRNKGFANLINAIRFSLRGLIAACKYESAFRQELALLILLTPLGLFIATSAKDFVLLLSVNLLVLVVELLNSAVEAAVDRVGLEHHEMAGLAKDYGSAAVMLALLIAGATWITFIAQYLIDYTSIFA